MTAIIQIIAAIIFFYVVTGIVHHLEKRGILRKGTLARGLGIDAGTNKPELKKVLLISVLSLTVFILLLITFFAKWK
jgi:hypothetical protein